MPASTNPNPLASVHPGAGTSFAVQEQEIAAASIGSSATKPFFLQYIDVTLTAAQVLGMFAAPFQLVAAPGAGFAVHVNKCIIEVVTVGFTAFAGGGVVAPQIDSTVHGGGTLLSTTLAAAVVNGATNVITQLDDTGANVTLVANKGVFLSNATGAFTTGTGGLRVYLYYAIIPIT